MSYDPSEDADQEDDNDKPDFDFDGAPLFENNGITAYPDKDKNGNWFLRVKTPAGISFPLFVNDNAHEGAKQVFNNMVEHFNDK